MDLLETLDYMQAKHAAFTIASSLIGDGWKEA